MRNHIGTIHSDGMNVDAATAPSSRTFARNRTNFNFPSVENHYKLSPAGVDVYVFFLVRCEGWKNLSLISDWCQFGTLPIILQSCVLRLTETQSKRNEKDEKVNRSRTAEGMREIMLWKHEKWHTHECGLCIKLSFGECYCSLLTHKFDDDGRKRHTLSIANWWYYLEA